MRIRRLLNLLSMLLLIVLMIVSVSACSDSESGFEEHGGNSEHNEQGEESGTQFSREGKFDEIRAGARLILSYDAPSNTFIGTIENTTERSLPRVRVEVHLSNGIELGPTVPVDLSLGESARVSLPASERTFTSWSAHAEVGGNGDAETEEHSGERGEHERGSESREHGGRE